MSTVDGLIGHVDVADDAVRRQAAARWMQESGSKAGWAGWLFALPALVMYLVFELYPVFKSIQYSFYNWNGIGLATWVGFDNYIKVFTEPELLVSIAHAFILIIFFTCFPRPDRAGGGLDRP